MIAARPEILAMKSAEHGGRRAVAAPVAYDFSVCLNAYGPASVVTTAVRDAAFDEYPDPMCREVRGVASSYFCRPIHEVALGAGAAELIHAVCLAYLRFGDRVLVVRPAFAEYERAAALFGAAIYSSSHDLDDLTRAVESCRPRLVFVASPINPTGESLEKSDLRVLADVCESTSSLLVLDQAYDAFQPSPLGTPALPGHPAVLHIRSLTKEHALAGIRVALAVGPRLVIDAIERARVPWSASSPAQAAAVAALSPDAIAHVSRTTMLLRDEARRIATECRVLDLEVSASSTHYLTIKLHGASTKERLLDRHRMLVRDCTSFGLPDRIRVAARTPTENDALLDALRDICAAND